MDRIINTRIETGKEENVSPYEYILVLKERRAFLATQKPRRTELIKRYSKKINELLPPREPIHPKTWQPGSFGESMAAWHSNKPDFVAWRKIQNKEKAKQAKSTRDRIISEFEK